jgi:hypothetical protein
LYSGRSRGSERVALANWFRHPRAHWRGNAWSGKLLSVARKRVDFPMHNSMLKLLAVVIALQGCAPSLKQQPTWEAHSDLCESGSACSVSGVLSIHEGSSVSTAVLTSGDRCTKLAVPDDFFRRASRWQNGPVLVRGIGFAEPRFDEGGGFVTFWYEERGRRVSLGWCDGGVVVYVTSIESASGKILTFE